MTMSYGEQILAARRRAGVSQSAVARKAGIHPTAMVEIERGRVEISEAQYHRLMAAVTALESAHEEAVSAGGRA